MQILPLWNLLNQMLLFPSQWTMKFSFQSLRTLNALLKTHYYSITKITKCKFNYSMVLAHILSSTTQLMSSFKPSPNQLESSTSPHLRTVSHCLALTITSKSVLAKSNAECKWETLLELNSVSLRTSYPSVHRQLLWWTFTMIKIENTLLLKSNSWISS